MSNMRKEQSELDLHVARPEMQMESEYGSESSEDELAHVDRGGGEAWRNHKSWAQIS